MNDDEPDHITALREIRDEADSALRQLEQRRVAEQLREQHLRSLPRWRRGMIRALGALARVLS